MMCQENTRKRGGPPCFRPWKRETPTEPVLFEEQVLQDRRIRIFAGHFGSGKTEVAVNYVLKLRELTEDWVGIADLDVVNPYFRSREKAAFFEERRIRTVYSAVAALHGDAPAVSGEVLAFLEDPRWQAVLDAGGDPEGARVLGRFAGKILPEDYDMFLVVNVHRPQTASVQAVLDLMARLEETSRLKVTAFINNSHMLKATRPEHVFAGTELLSELERKTGLKTRYTCAIRPVVERLRETGGEPSLPRSSAEGSGGNGLLFPLDLRMREDWMS
jgi:hypothetical protein